MPRRKTVAVLFLQPQCDMTCRFCITRDGFDRLSTGEALALVRDVREKGYASVVLGGGEPLAWPGDLERVAAEAKARGLTVQVVTNGIGLADALIGNPAIDRFVLPIEAAAAEVHDRLRIWAGGSHHALVLDRLRALAAAGKSVTLSTVVTRINIDELPAIGRLLAAHDRPAPHIHSWHIYRFLCEGRGGAPHAGELAVGRSAFAQACRQMRRQALPFKVYRRTDMYAPETVAFFWRENGQVVTGCRQWEALSG